MSTNNDDLQYFPWSELRKRPRRKLLMPQICFEKGVTTWVAQSGWGKTTTVLSVAMTIGTGGVWDGLAIKKCPFIWNAGEDLDGVRAMEEAWRRAHPEACDPEAWFLDGEVDLSTDANVTELLRKLADLPMSPLIVFDALTDMIGDLNEDSAQDMTRVYKGGLRRISEERNASVIALHHSGWNTARERGSSAIRGKSDIVIRGKKFDVKNGIVGQEHLKLRDGVKLKLFGYEMKLVSVPGYPEKVPIVTGVRTDAKLKEDEANEVLNQRPGKRPNEAETCARKLVELLLDKEKFPGGATSGELEEACGSSHGTYHTALKLVKDRNWLVGGGERDSLYNLGPDASWKEGIGSNIGTLGTKVHAPIEVLVDLVPSTDPCQSNGPNLDRVCTVNQSEVEKTTIQPADPPKAGVDPLSKAAELLNRRNISGGG